MCQMSFFCWSSSNSILPHELFEIALDICLFGGEKNSARTNKYPCYLFLISVVLIPEMNSGVRHPLTLTDWFQIVNHFGLFFLSTNCLVSTSLYCLLWIPSWHSAEILNSCIPELTSICSNTMWKSRESSVSSSLSPPELLRPLSYLWNWNVQSSVSFVYATPSSAA